MIYFSVKNYEKHQHYKERNPIWIKLYVALLEDYEFAKLPDASKAHLIAIWMLASRYKNSVPYDAQWISTRINATCAVDLGILERAGFIIKIKAQDDPDNLLAQHEKDASLETETDYPLPNGNGRDAAPQPPTLKSQIFGPCLDWLAKASDCTPAKLRSQVGRWCKEYGDASVIDSIATAQRESPVDPRAWIERHLKTRGTNVNATGKRKSGNAFAAAIQDGTVADLIGTSGGLGEAA